MATDPGGPVFNPDDGEHNESLRRSHAVPKPVVAEKHCAARDGRRKEEVSRQSFRAVRFLRAGAKPKASLVAAPRFDQFPLSGRPGTLTLVWSVAAGAGPLVAAAGAAEVVLAGAAVAAGGFSLLISAITSSVIS